jgi:hypothetical protein
VQIRRSRRRSLGRSKGVSTLALPPSYPLAVNSGGDIATKRALLLSARTRFAPETQNLKQAAIDKTVEQVLLRAPDTIGLSLPAIHTKVNQALGNGTVVGLRDVKNALTRLGGGKRVAGKGQGLEERVYALLPDARDSLREAQRASDGRLSLLVNRLFRRAPGRPDRYADPFFECLRLIFGQVANSYVRQITGRALPEEILAHQAVADALTACGSAFPDIDAGVFRRGVMSFLTEVDPDSSAVKWNLTQNSYLLGALGLDEKGLLLSREVLGGAVLYLDTNVLIQALEPRARLHRSCTALANACSSLGISLRVAYVSIMELQGVIAYNKELMSKVVDQIPDETAPKVTNVFYQAYFEARQENPSLTVDEFFESYEDPGSKLGAMQCATVDDSWFVENARDAKTRALVQQIRREYDARHPEQPKREKAATHDALMIRWVERERLGDYPKSWLVTLDTSLPTFVPDDGGTAATPLAITLDALLQWISPMAAREGFDEDLSDIFSAALRQQILPHENFLTLQDFLIFAELDCSCRDLPGEDVEECIRRLASHTHADLSDPKNREALAHEVARFFADPGRKYKGALEQLEQRLQKKDGEISALAASHMKAMDALQQETRAQTDELQAGLDRLKKERAEEREARRKEEEARLTAGAHGRLVVSARRRLVLSLLLFAGLEFLAVLLSLKYSSGENWLQKTIGFWPLLVIAAAVSILLGATVIIGRKRLHVLPAVFRELFGSPSST